MSLAGARARTEARPMHPPTRQSDDPSSSSAPPVRPAEAVAVARRILLATDLSSASASATDEAMAIARRTGASLVVVSAVDPRLLRLSGGRFLRRIDQERARVEAGVGDVVRRARERGLSTRYLVGEGEPSEGILEAARAEAADLVVVGSHGRGRLGRLLLGSTSRRVSEEAHCRVLVVQS